MTRTEKMEKKLKDLGVHEFRGEFHRVSELCVEYKRINGEEISKQLLGHRLKVGWGIEDAMSINEPETHLCPDGHKRTFHAIAEVLGISYNTWFGRISLGYSVFEAFELKGRGPYKPRKEKESLIPQFTEFEKQFL